MLRRFAVFAVGLGLCALLACEFEPDSETGPGPGSGTGTPIRSTASLDGWARSDGNSSATGAPITGDIDGSLPGGIGYRQFFSFDISSFSSVTEATLRLYQQEVIGMPYPELGNVVVDHLVYGDALDAPDYHAAALATVGTLSTDANKEYKTLNVTAQVKADVAAGRKRSQFRVRFSSADSNNDGTTDFTYFTDGEFTGTNFPMLVVR